ncbi:MAG: 1-deoxy-D-xylulose-5-phosphate synthase N-terminal domain-containing protein [Methanogenium sp.]|jgi:transketolase
MDLKSKAKQLRNAMLLASSHAGRGHLGGALSCIDILIALYYQNFLNNNNFILSKGHSAIALYTVLRDLEKLGDYSLFDFCQDGSILAEHPCNLIPGVLATAGSLGHGLGIASGMALADKLANNGRQTYVLVGDGECNEGSIWEAVRFAAEQELSNLHMIIDSNGLRSTDEANLPGLHFILVNFGWIVTETDGHDFEKITKAFKYVPIPPNKRPRAYIMNTVKGKGISFMENDVRWHNGVPSGELLQKALKEFYE